MFLASIVNHNSNASFICSSLIFCVCHFSGFLCLFLALLICECMCSTQWVKHTRRILWLSIKEVLKKWFSIKLATVNRIIHTQITDAPSSMPIRFYRRSTIPHKLSEVLCVLNIPCGNVRLAKFGHSPLTEKRLLDHDFFTWLQHIKNFWIIWSSLYVIIFCAIVSIIALFKCNYWQSDNQTIVRDYLFNSAIMKTIAHKIIVTTIKWINNSEQL